MRIVETYASEIPSFHTKITPFSLKPDVSFTILKGFDEFPNQLCHKTLSKISKIVVNVFRKELVAYFHQKPPKTGWLMNVCIPKKCDSIRSFLPPQFCTYQLHNIDKAFCPFEHQTYCSLISSGSSWGRPLRPYSDSLASSVSKVTEKEKKSESNNGHNLWCKRIVSSMEPRQALATSEITPSEVHSTHYHSYYQTIWCTKIQINCSIFTRVITFAIFHTTIAMVVIVQMIFIVEIIHFVKVEVGYVAGILRWAQYRHFHTLFRRIYASESHGNRFVFTLFAPVRQSLQMDIQQHTTFVFRFHFFGLA